MEPQEQKQRPPGVVQPVATEEVRLKGPSIVFTTATPDEPVKVTTSYTSEQAGKENLPTDLSMKPTTGQPTPASPQSRENVIGGFEPPSQPETQLPPGSVTGQVREETIVRERAPETGPRSTSEQPFKPDDLLTGQPRAGESSQAPVLIPEQAATGVQPIQHIPERSPEIPTAPELSHGAAAGAGLFPAAEEGKISDEQLPGHAFAASQSKLEPTPLLRDQPSGSTGAERQGRPIEVTPVATGASFTKEGPERKATVASQFPEQEIMAGDSEKFERRHEPPLEEQSATSQPPFAPEMNVEPRPVLSVPPEQTTEPEKKEAEQRPPPLHPLWAQEYQLLGLPAGTSTAADRPLSVRELGEQLPTTGAAQPRQHEKKVTFKSPSEPEPLPESTSEPDVPLTSDQPVSEQSFLKEKPPALVSIERPALPEPSRTEIESPEGGRQREVASQFPEQMPSSMNKELSESERSLAGSEVSGERLPVQLGPRQVIGAEGGDQLEQTQIAQTPVEETALPESAGVTHTDSTQSLQTRQMDERQTEMKLPRHAFSNTESKIDSSQKSDQKVVVVTGGSKGIGYAVVKGILAAHPDWIVYLTSRNEKRGDLAVKKLREEFDLTAHFHPLDVDSQQSVKVFCDFLLENHKLGGIDILIHNAGCYLNVPFRADNQQSKFDKLLFDQVLSRNFWSTWTVCQSLLPLMADDGKVVLVSSRHAQLAFMHTNDERKRQLRYCSKVEDVCRVMEAFSTADLSMITTATGWLTKAPELEAFPLYNFGLYPFGMSKLGVSLLAQIYQREFDAEKSSRNLHINACCPGMVKTESNPSATRTPEEGADSIVWLALQPDDSSIKGQFVAERKVFDPFFLTVDERKFSC